MINGDIKKINLSISSFEQMIEGGYLYIDKTRLIENFLNSASSVQLVARQRRLGKSLNMDMLRCFLTDSDDHKHLFKGLYIENSPAWNKVNSAPVFHFDFKELDANTYKDAIYDTVCDYIDQYCSDVKLSRQATRYLKEDNPNDARGLRHLTESVFKATGKHSYILIDEYDKLLMDYYKTDRYEEIREFETTFLSAGMKGNPYLAKAMLTGVMRVSHESILSGLNNIKIFDVFSDSIYFDDYGLIEQEVAELAKLVSFDFDQNEARAWYNGVRVNSKPIYNTYSFMSFIDSKVYECFWGKSGAMDIITSLLNDERKLELAKMLNGERVIVPISSRMSLQRLSSETGDEAFYSFLVQAGYLSLEESINDKRSAILAIPNKELMIVWKDFVLTSIYENSKAVRTLFDNSHDIALFASDVEYFLTDRLSYYDLMVLKNEDARKVYERVYHTFVLGILSAYDDVCHQRPLSNRESGNGRYDILVQRSEANFIFEFKACLEGEDLSKFAGKALQQIDTKRYGADLIDRKTLVKIGIAIYGKQCKVKCA